MSLQVTLSRGADKRQLGNFDQLEIVGNELREAGSTEALARHVHHRWHIADAPHTYIRLDIVGPVTVEVLEGAHDKLGPYQEFTMENGVLHADTRVFGFVDVERNDCYVSDLGEHRKALKLMFYPGR
jgi:hypothetical protein